MGGANLTQNPRSAIVQGKDATDSESPKAGADRDTRPQSKYIDGSREATGFRFQENGLRMFSHLLTVAFAIDGQ